MKIAILCSPSIGGSGIVATELSLGMAMRGHEIHFISHSKPALLNTSEKIFFS